MTPEKKAQGLVGDEYEKARLCLQGQNHEGFQVQISTTNADAHLLRLFLAVQANPKHVLASFDVSNAYLNAELSEDVIILTQPAPELIQFGLVKPGTHSTNAPRHVMVLCEAPKLCEEARDKTLTSVVFQIDNVEYSLRQSTYHPRSMVCCSGDLASMGVRKFACQMIAAFLPFQSLANMRELQHAQSTWMIF